MRLDIIDKDYFMDNRRYADIINGIGCRGEQIVKPEDLQEMDSQIILPSQYSVQGRGTQESYSRQIRFRDMIRKTAFGVNFSMIGIENQENIDYAYPLRNLEYDVGMYHRQYAGNKRFVRQKRQLTKGEYLYGFTKDCRLHPVVTILIYYGKEAWDASKDLHGILDFTDIPDSIKGMVSNYKTHVIDVRRMTDKDTQVFRTDVKQVFDFIRYSEEKEKLIQLVEEETRYQNLREEAYRMIAEHTYTKSLLQRTADYQNAEGEINMCKAIDDWLQEKREEGIQEGRRTIIANMLKCGMSDSQICTLAECDMKMLEEIRQTILTA